MLDADVLQHLSDEQKARLVELEKTFDTKGWGVIKTFANQKAEDIGNRMLNVNNWEEYNQLRGALRAYAGFANFENETYNEFMARAAEAQAENGPAIEDFVLD